MVRGPVTTKVIEYLSAHPDSSSGELCRALRKDSRNMSAVLDTLWKQKKVTRRQHEGKTRVAWLYSVAKEDKSNG